MLWIQHCKSCPVSSSNVFDSHSLKQALVISWNLYTLYTSYATWCWFYIISLVYAKRCSTVNPSYLIFIHPKRNRLTGFLSFMVFDSSSSKRNGVISFDVGASDFIPCLIKSWHAKLSTCALQDIMFSLELKRKSFLIWAIDSM
jgi:hypothetical protein